MIGRTIRVNGVPSTVIGVMPDGFLFPLRSFVWRPLVALDVAGKTDRGARGLRAIGRLKPGVTNDQAVADLSSIASALATQYPVTNTGFEPGVEIFRSGIGGPILPLLASMMGAVGVVLLIACANVANLLLSRSAGRAREMSVRMSIGASRWRIVRQLLMESLLLAVVAGGVGLLLSMASVQLFWSTASQTNPPYWLHFSMDWRVFSFLAAVCLGTSIVFGLVPALHTSKTNLTDVLNEAGRGSAGNRRGRRWTGALVAGQLALALVLLTGAGLMVRNVLVMLATDAGVDTASLVRLRLDAPSPAYDASERRLAFYRQLEERISSTPTLRASAGQCHPAPWRRIPRLRCRRPTGPDAFIAASSDDGDHRAELLRRCSCPPVAGPRVRRRRRNARPRRGHRQRAVRRGALPGLGRYRAAHSLFGRHVTS